jgi:hypothetical protein
MGQPFNEAVKDLGITSGAVAFTRFVPPNGRRVREEIPMATPELLTKAGELVAAGYSFEIERLATGPTNMDCCDDDGAIGQKLSRLDDGPEEIVKLAAELVTESYDLWKNTLGGEPTKAPRNIVPTIDGDDSPLPEESQVVSEPASL